jgi:hypothetical protein
MELQIAGTHERMGRTCRGCRMGRCCLHDHLLVPSHLVNLRPVSAVGKERITWGRNDDSECIMSGSHSETRLEELLRRWS